MSLDKNTFFLILLYYGVVIRFSDMIHREVFMFFFRSLLSCFLSAALIFSSVVPVFAQNKTSEPKSEITVRQTPVLEEWQQQKINQALKPIDKSINKALKEESATKEVITDRMNKITAVVTDMTKAYNAKGKNPSQKNTDDYQNKVNQYKALVDELNGMIISDLEKEYSTLAKEILAENNVYKLMVLQDHIASGTISTEDYDRAVKALSKTLYQPCKKQECEVRGAAMLTLATAGTGKVTKRHGKDLKFINELATRIANAAKQNYGGLESDKIIGDHIIPALAIIRSPRGMRDAIQSYVNKYGQKERYEPASNPNDAFLVHLTELAVEYPVMFKTNNSSTYQTPQLLVTWSNSPNFLLRLRGNIEIGRFSNQQQYFSADKLAAVKDFLKNSYCGIGSNYGTNVHGTAADKQAARRDISLGYWGGKKHTDSIYKTGDARCTVDNILYQTNISPREIQADLANKALRTVVLFVIPPGCVLAAAAKPLKAVIKAQKAANKTGKSFRRIYTSAKKVSQGQKNAEKAKHALDAVAETSAATKVAGASSTAAKSSSAAAKTSTAAKPAAQTAAKPAAQTAAKPAAQTAAKPAAQTAAKPAAQATPTTPVQGTATYNPQYTYAPQMGGPSAGMGGPSRGKGFAHNVHDGRAYYHPEGAQYTGTVKGPTTHVVTGPGTSIEVSADKAAEVKQYLDIAANEAKNANDAVKDIYRQIAALEKENKKTFGFIGKGKRQEEINRLNQSLGRAEKKAEQASSTFNQVKTAAQEGRSTEEAYKMFSEEYKQRQALIAANQKAAPAANAVTKPSAQVAAKPAETVTAKSAAVEKAATVEKAPAASAVTKPTAQVAAKPAETVTAKSAAVEKTASKVTTEPKVAEVRKVEEASKAKEVRKSEEFLDPERVHQERLAKEAKQQELAKRTEPYREQIGEIEVRGIDAKNHRDASLRELEKQWFDFQTNTATDPKEVEAMLRRLEQTDALPSSITTAEYNALRTAAENRATALRQYRSIKYEPTTRAGVEKQWQQAQQQVRKAQEKVDDVEEGLALAKGQQQTTQQTVETLKARLNRSSYLNRPSIESQLQEAQQELKKWSETVASRSRNSGHAKRLLLDAQNKEKQVKQALDAIPTQEQYAQYQRAFENADKHFRQLANDQRAIRAKDITEHYDKVLAEYQREINNIQREIERVEQSLK